jgi:integrase
MAKKVGFASIHLHSLRHSHASQLLSRGVPLSTVSKRLGHADAAITARVYAPRISRRRWNRSGNMEHGPAESH